MSIVLGDTEGQSGSSIRPTLSKSSCWNAGMAASPSFYQPIIHWHWHCCLHATRLSNIAPVRVFTPSRHPIPISLDSNRLRRLRQLSVDSVNNSGASMASASSCMHVSLSARSTLLRELHTQRSNRSCIGFPHVSNRSHSVKAHQHRSLCLLTAASYRRSQGQPPSDPIGISHEQSPRNSGELRQKPYILASAAAVMLLHSAGRPRGSFRNASRTLKLRHPQCALLECSRH